MFNPGGGTGVQKSENRVDIASCHFMSEPTSLSFGGIPSDGDIPRFRGYEYTPDEREGTLMTTQGSANEYDGAGQMNVGFQRFGMRVVTIYHTIVV